MSKNTTTFIPEKQSIVILGAWNPAIIQGHWLAKYVFQAQKLNYELSMGEIAIQRFKNEETNVSICLDQNRLVINAFSNTNECRLSAVTVAKKIIETLNHTPIVALGFNFSYVIESPCQMVLGLQNFDDESDVLDKLTEEKEASSITRQFKLKSGKHVNFTISTSVEGKVVFDYNFDFKGLDKIGPVLDNDQIFNEFFGIAESIQRAYQGDE